MLSEQEQAWEFIAAHFFNDEITISPQKWNSFAGDKNLLVATLVFFIQHHRIFPWKRFFVASSFVLMDNLKKFQPVKFSGTMKPHNVQFFSQYQNAPFFSIFTHTTFVSQPQDYDTMDVLTDIFQEKQRLLAKRKDTTQSVLERWYTDAFFVRDCILLVHGDICSKNLREAIYQKAKECTQFKPSLAVAIYKHFKATRVLDFSAGWGDRLAAAIACGISYDGYDPNTDLKTGHDEMIALFNGQNVAVTYVPFEKAVIKKKYDLVFTSPPFFDFEIYSALDGQSIDTFPTIEKWLGEFMTTCLLKAWDALDQEGYLVLHITDVFTTKVCEPICLIATWLLDDCQYHKVICSQGLADKARPMWAFQKVYCKSKKQEAEAELARLFPSVHKTVTNFLKK